MISLQDICICGHTRRQHYNNFIAGTACRSCTCQKFTQRKDKSPAPARQWVLLHITPEELADILAAVQEDIHQQEIRFLDPSLTRSALRALEDVRRNYFGKIISPTVEENGEKIDT